MPHATQQTVCGEQRHHRRLRLILPVEIRMVGDERLASPVRAVTHNICTGGAYVVTDMTDDLPIWVELAVRFHLSTEICHSMIFTLLDAQAVVMRAEASYAHAPGVSRAEPGIALQFNSRPTFSSILDEEVESGILI